MMSKWQERIMKQVREAFAEHQALVFDGTRLTWQRPDSGMYNTTYMRSGGLLIVYGDMGQAMYQVTGDHGFRWWADTDLSYFCGKCVASEVGREFVQWDANTAIDRVTEFIEETEETGLDKTKVDLLKAHAYDISEFQDALRDVVDYETMEQLWDAGKVIHHRCIYHWLGLQMAVEQLAGTTNNA